MDARRHFKNLSLSVVVAIMLLVPLNLDLVLARTGLDDAIKAAIELSELESTGRAPNLYRQLHSDARAIIPESAVIGWYEVDFFPLQPQPISEIVSAQFVDWTWGVTGQTYRHTAEIAFIQPFGSGAHVTYQQETVRLVEDEGEWRWFFGRSAEFVNEQIARFPGALDQSTSRSSNRNTSRTAQSSSRDSSASRTQRSSSGCTLVELYPGYPMYRGVLTGMLVNWGGLGDWACLEELERLDSRFDLEAEDRANVAAARELGIDGQPEDWLWENWLQIEAVRGLPSQCYSCVLKSNGIVPITTSVQVDASDPRVLAGSWNGWDSYTYRSMAFINGWDQIFNAPQLLNMYNSIAKGDSGVAYLTAGDVRAYALIKGGYTWVPASANVQDQEFMMIHSFAAAVPAAPMLMIEAQVAPVVEGISQWKINGYPGSLREYLQGYL